MTGRAPSSDQLVRIARCLSGVEAELVRCHLEAANIGAFVSNASVVAMDWTISNAIGGVEVLVRQSDAQAALEVLERKDPVPLAELATGDELLDYGDPTEEDPVEAEHESDLNTREELASRAFRAAVVGLIVFPLQIYVAWLLVNVLFETQPMRSKYIKQAWIATILCAPFVALLILFLKDLV